MRPTFTARSLALLSLVSSVLLAAACSGGGGHGGGDDDDDVLPTPARPGFVVLRLDTMLSIANADGSDLVDITDAPGGEKSLVGFTDDDRVVYMVKPAVSSTAGDLWIVGVDGSDNHLLAAGVYAVHGWVGGDRLLFQRGPGPELAFPPRRDLYAVTMSGVETPLATAAEDESLAGVRGTTVVFLRGVPSLDADLFAIPVSGGAEVPLTSSGGPKSFAGFTGTDRVVYKDGAPNTDVYAVDLTGGTPNALATRANPEDVAAIRGSRVVILEIIPTMDASESDLYAIDEDGRNEVALAVAVDIPETLAGLTASGRGLILRQTGFDPPAFELFSIPLSGGSETALDDLTDGGVLIIDGETIVYSGGGDLFAIESDASGAQTLASGPTDEEFLGYAGGRVLFKSGTPSKVWSVAVGGGSPVKLRDTMDGETFNVVLGPMTVMTVIGAGNKTDLVAARTSGGNLRTLASDDDTETFRAITPDGRVIYTLNQGQFLDDVLIVNPDGTGTVNLTGRAGEDELLGFLP